MILKSGSKLCPLGALLLVSLIVSLALLTCRPETSSSEEIGLVWEAWRVVKSSYVEGDSLDSEQTVGNMIIEMLDSGDKPAYPFLTELANVRGRPSRDVPRELTDVWKAWTLFHEKWPDVDLKLLANAAVAGMLGSLGDNSVAHLTPETYARAQESLEPTYQGIGAFVTTENGRILLSPMSESPAEKAGLEAGDVLLEVDGLSVDGKSLQEVVEQVKGPVGERVILLVERPGEEEPQELRVFRGEIDMVSIDRQLLPGAIGYIYIPDFPENIPDEVLDALEELRLFDILALILDLRSNPGGSMEVNIESAQKVASQFLSDGLFMYEIDKEGIRKDWPIEDGGMTTGDMPMIVIVNGLTGSAAEAVAGALQDAQRAKILGTRTLGKGSASAFKELSDGSAIYIPVSRWYTPSGRPMQGSGIEPDVEVVLTAEDLLLDRDSQLTEAYDYLNDLLSRTVPFR